MVSLQSSINYHRTKEKTHTEKSHYSPCEQLYWILRIITSVILVVQLMKYIVVSSTGRDYFCVLYSIVKCSLVEYWQAQIINFLYSFR